MELASKNPGETFFGLELRLKRLVLAAKKIKREQLENILLMRERGEYLDDYFEEGSINVLHINFPDPWSKKGRRKHRIFNQDFLKMMHRLFVPFGEIWNPGANDATDIELSRNVTINGNALAAGKYSLWAIPDPNRWTIIFNSQADVYHTPYPGEETDALRFMASPRLGEHMETLAFYFSAVEKKTAELRLHWGDTFIPFEITVP